MSEEVKIDDPLLLVLQKELPDVPLAALKLEVKQLHDQLIYGVSGLSKLSEKDLLSHGVKLGTVKALGFYLKKSDETGPRTVEEVISQKLPAIIIRDNHSSTVCTRPTKRHYPQYLIPFEEFLKEARNFVGGDAPVTTDMGTKPDVAIAANEMQVHMAAWRNICLPLTRCAIFGVIDVRHASGHSSSSSSASSSCSSLSSSSSSSSSSSASASSSTSLGKRKTRVIVGEPDLAAWAETGGYATVEIKTPWTLVSMPDSSTEICRRFAQGDKAFEAEDGDSKKVQETKETDKKHWLECRRVIAQEFGYMVDNNHKWGAISTYERTWFVFAIDADTLMISDALHETDANALRIWAYFFSEAKKAPKFEIPPEFERRQSSVDEDDEQEEDDDEADDDGDFRSKKKGPSSKRGSTKKGKQEKKKASTTKGADSGGSKKKGVTEYSESAFKVLASGISCVPWKSLELLSGIQHGRSGYVVLASYASQLVAIKLFDIGKRGEKAFLSELNCYQAAKSVQGVAIPRLLFVTESPSGGVVGLGLELGSRLGSSFVAWDDDVRQQAFGAIQMLAKICGVAQNDMRPDNFVLGSQGQVVVVDLEDTKKLSDTKQREAYLQRARYAIGVK